MGKGADTVEAIRREAISEFRARGFQAARLEDIAERLGITRAAVLHHYGAKDRLLGAVVAPYLDVIEATLGSFELSPQPSRQQLRDIVAAIVEVFFEHRLIAGILFRDVSSRTDQATEARIAASVNRFRKLILGSESTEGDRCMVDLLLGAMLQPITDPDVDVDNPVTRSTILHVGLGIVNQMVSGTRRSEPLMFQT